MLSLDFLLPIPGLPTHYFQAIPVLTHGYPKVSIVLPLGLNPDYPEATTGPTFNNSVLQQQTLRLLFGSPVLPPPPPPPPPGFPMLIIRIQSSLPRGFLYVTSLLS